MVFHKIQKAIAVSVIASLVATSVPSTSYTKVLEASAKTTENNPMILGNAEVSESDEGVFKVTMDDTGYITADADNVAADVNTPFSWDNANVYFVLTDRFENGDDSNDHSYGRSTKEKDASNYANRVGTFHGGDLKGLTDKLEEGYFDKLGTNAIWISAPYEQIHGAMCGNQFKHYAYHGYYVLDYTNVDANMGTAADLKKFVTTAHEHGIRVIFDIVMNHAGYADAYTANEYGFGKLSSNWESTYYEKDENSYSWKDDYAAYGGMMVGDSSWQKGWWGTSWLRAVEKNGDGTDRFPGYGGAENGDDITMCSSGLPDFRTGDSNEVGIPDILKTKWTKEGVMSEKTAQIDSMFQRTGLQKNVTGYLVGWLSEWVKDYGIDGFRCDTAKHVEKSNWKKLYVACNDALKQWREENPNEPGAQWKDEFWMTGEAWGWGGLSPDGYFTEGGFTSMINFAYQGVEKASGSELEGTYSRYANSINTKEGFNVLSYISSHDKGLGARSANAGTALLLTPGGVQTFYGDESGRPAGRGNDYEPARSHMNWDSTNTAILSNWQKVGQFRRNHIAVGAGKHEQIAASPYTFSRTYTGEATVGSELQKDYTDKVVVSLPTKEGTYDVSVGDIFEDGATVIDEYSGEEYTVSGGKVSGVKCDSNGVILLAEPAVTTPKAKIMSSVSKGTESGGVYNTDSLTLKLSTQNVKDASYQINKLEPVSFTESTEVTIGEDTAYEETTTITIKGTSEIDGEAVSKEFTYSRGKEPVIGAETEGFTLRVKKSDFTAAPTIWIWSETEKVNYCTNEWPGDPLTEDGDFYVYNNAKITDSAKFIISQGEYRNTQEGETELSAKGSVLFDKASNSVKEYLVASGEPCKVTVEYLNGSGEVIKTISRVGAEGEEYTVYAPENLSTVVGAKLAEGEESSVKGTFTTKETTIQFKYSVNGEVVQTKAPATKEPEKTEEPKKTEEPVKTKEPEKTEEPKKTEEPVKTEEPKKTEEPVKTEEPKKTETPTTKAPEKTETPATKVPEKTEVPSTAEPEEEFVVGITASKKSVVAGKTVKLTAKATGGNGSYTYKFVAEKGGNSSTIRGFAKTSTFNWKPTKAGTYTVVVYAKDIETGIMTTEEVKVKVTAAPLVIKLFKVLNLGKLKVQIKANATGGTGALKYKYTYKYKGKTKTIKNYSGTKSLKKVMKKPGTYTFKVYVKDSKNGKVVKTKTFKLKVKK